jgi:hypothetical protein
MVNKEEKPKVKKYYTIKVEALVPAEVSFRVLAEDEYEALEMFERGPMLPLEGPIRPRLAGMKKIEARVYDAGTIGQRLHKRY